MREPKRWTVSGMSGRKHSAETKEKMRVAHLGRKRSDETKAKIRTTLRRRYALMENA